MLVDASVVALVDDAVVVLVDVTVVVLVDDGVIALVDVTVVSLPDDAVVVEVTDVEVPVRVLLVVDPLATVALV